MSWLGDLRAENSNLKTDLDRYMRGLEEQVALRHFASAARMLCEPRYFQVSLVIPDQITEK